MIEFQGASVEAASGATIVHPLTLKLTEQRIALIGMNGSGKSTIARLINGLITPSAGNVLLHTEDGPYDTVRHGRQVRARIGFMFSDPQAGLVMPTAAEDVALSLKRLIPKKSDRVTATDAVLQEYGLTGRGEQSVHTLSGGQQQLLALASVLATNPDVLVADEPTTLLDLRNSLLITQRLMTLQQQLIVATHNLELAAQCERVLLVDDGRVIDDGAPQPVIDRYREHVARTLEGEG